MEKVPAIEARGLGYVYGDGRRAIEGVDLAVAPGEAVGVAGPNGAGKTTLLLVLAGIHPPSEGGVSIFGVPVPKGNGARIPPDLRRRIGLVFQETDDQLFSPSVFDDVAFGPLNFDFPRAEVKERVGRALAAVALPGYEERTPHHLSAGEKRRVAIATAISYDPDILILDEPTSDLDPRGRRELAKLLNRMAPARIIASHDLEFVLRTCGRLVLIDGGRVRADGPTPEILSDRALLEAHGLAVPIGLDGLGAAEIRELRDRS